MGLITLKAGRSASPDKREQVFTEEMIREMNEKDNRMTLTRDELKALIDFCVGNILIGQANETLERFERHCGVRHIARCASGMLLKCVRTFPYRMDAKQNITVQNNTGGCNVYLTMPPETSTPKVYLNVEKGDLIALTNQCLRQCAFCDKSRKDSKYCPVKRALDNIPNYSGRDEKIVDDVTKCKYQFVEIEELD